MQIRDRIKELRRVKASQLRPHPKNWRVHPQAQQDALRGLLAEIGYADALLARQLPDGSLELIDGHLRAETTPDMEVPVLIVDLDDQEAAKLLALHDPLTGLATTDHQILADLLGDVTTTSSASRAPRPASRLNTPLSDPSPTRSAEVPIPDAFQVVVNADEAAQRDLFERLSPRATNAGC